MSSTHQETAGQDPFDGKLKSISEQSGDMVEMFQDLRKMKGSKGQAVSNERPFSTLVTELNTSLNQDSPGLISDITSAITKHKEKHIEYQEHLKQFRDVFKEKLQNAKRNITDVFKCVADEECKKLDSAAKDFEIEDLFDILDDRLNKSKPFMYERLLCAMSMLDLDKNLPVLITEVKDPDPLMEALGLKKQKKESSETKMANLYCHIREKLIDGQTKPYDKFLFKLGDLYPHLFRKLVGKEPDAEYLKHNIKDKISEMSEKIKEQPFQADREIDKTISGDNYVSLSVSRFKFGSNRSRQPSFFVRHEGDEPIVLSEALTSEFSPKIIPDPSEHGTGKNKQMEDLDSFTGEDSKLEDLLNKAKDTHRRILIQGRCGVGKTTMIQNMAYKWAQERSLQSFFLFFLIKIRSLGKELSLYELLTKNSLYPSKIPEEWLNEYQHRIFICIDGLDELNKFSDSMRNATKISEIHEKTSARDIVINVLRRNLLPKATVIATSRPFVGLDTLRPDINLEITGLTKERIIEFITKNVEESGQGAVKKSLKENPSLLSLCTFPYYASKVINYLKDDQDQDLRSINTYSELHAFIILDHFRRETNDPTEQESFNQSLPALAEIAGRIFDHTKTEDHLFGMHFDMNDIFKIKTAGANDAVKQGKKHGLIQIMSMPAGSQTRHLLEFSHLSVQEMLCAIHLLKESDENIEILRKAVSQLKNSESLEMLQIFLFAVAFDQNSKHLKSLRERIMGEQKRSKQKEKILSEAFDSLLAKISEDDHHLLKLCQLSYETQNRELAKKVSSKIKSRDKGLCLKDISINAIDIKALVFVLQDAHLEEITLEKNNLSEYSCELLLKGLGQKEIMKSMKAVRLIDNQIEQKETLKHVSELLRKNKNLETIDLSKNSITDETFEDLLPGLSRKSDKAIFLNIENNPVSVQRLSCCLDSSLYNIHSLEMGYICPSYENYRMDCTDLAIALSVNTTLKHLNLPGNNIGRHGAQSLASVIADNDSLESLGIGNNNIKDPGAIAIAKALEKRRITSLDLHSNQIHFRGSEIINSLKNNFEIQTLNLSHNHLGVDGAKQLAHFLKTNTSLRNLSIADNAIKSAGAEHIAEALMTNISLDFLNISDNGIGDDGARSIAKVLKHNDKLRILSLRKNYINDEGAKKIGEALMQNTNLQYLDINENIYGDVGEQYIEWGLNGKNSIYSIFYFFIVLEMKHNLKLLSVYTFFILILYLFYLVNFIGNWMGWEIEDEIVADIGEEIIGGGIGEEIGAQVGPEDFL